MYPIGYSESSLKDFLPAVSLNLYVLAGEILDRLESLNRTAKIAFDGNAEIAGQLNKDPTLRGRKARTQAAAGEAEAK